MNKPNVKIDVLKKMIARLVKAAPARRTEPADPLKRLIRGFLEYDCDEARAAHAERKISETMVDFNELRVTPAIELAALLGVRYPFAESRCSALHRTLQSIFDREHQMRLDRLKEMKRTEVRPYFQSLAGITPYVEAAVCVDAFAVPAAPVDTKLLLWLISKDVLAEGTDIRSAQHVIEKHLKAAEAEDFFLGSRREIDDWSPKSWPQVAKAYSPILAPPPINAAGEPEDPAKRDGKKAEPAKEPSKEPSKPKPMAAKKK